MAAVALAAANACVREGRLPAARLAAVFATNNLMLISSSGSASLSGLGENDDDRALDAPSPGFSHPSRGPIPTFCQNLHVNPIHSRGRLQVPGTPEGEGLSGR